SRQRGPRGPGGSSLQAEHADRAGSSTRSPPAMMLPARRARRLAVLTNILAPYRLPIYHRLAEHFDLTVLYSGHEPNRSQWNGLADRLQLIGVKRSRGIVIP